MNKTEKRAAFTIAGIFSLRMLGLFMILPVFAPYGQHLSGSTPFLIGLALGIYGLGQAILQIPFGMLSDKIGRKAVIVIGLILFGVGSIVAALSTTILGVIIGRLLQGTGAIGSTCTAYVADTTQDENRSKSMAMIGMTIATSFFLAMIIGPILASLINVNGIFYLTALFALFGIGLTLTAPASKKLLFHSDSQVNMNFFNSVLKNPELLRLDLGIFISHAILTAIFTSLPLILLNVGHVNINQQWEIYLPALALAYIAIFPMIIITEAKRCLKQGLLFAVGGIVVAMLGLWFFYHSIVMIGICLFIFFTVFSFLEASIPSLVSKIAPVKNRGTAIGVYSSCQFFGIFFGGLVGGYFSSHHHLSAVFLFAAIIAALWFIVAIFMRQPPYLSLKILSIAHLDASKTAQLQAECLKIHGIEDVAIMPKEQAAYLKVDKKRLDAESLDKLFK